ncbi:hypothetical protein [Mesorhizobium sp. CN2-181]|uniref:hypothetical protein n=1 Tax=Mesorhizobium yinganensis TaxID=3157707 RepID=UPI0032B7EE95
MTTTASVLEGPFWHGQNPWADSLVYVPIEELAACSMLIGRNLQLADGTTVICTIEHMLNHWHEYGDKLDAYVLTGPLLTGGVRFGPEGENYLSPGFSLPKLRELMIKHRIKSKRPGAFVETSVF